MRKLLIICLLLAFGASAQGAATLVYDGGGSQARIQTALTNLGIAFDLRNAANPVTAADLASHSVLVVGWNYMGDMSGLNPATLASGIAGNILLSGHDADYHGASGTGAAATFLSQAVSFGQTGAGTGLVAMCDYSTTYSYLPAAWGISATGGFNAETISSITAAGLASGVYSGLTPLMMSGWSQSYHGKFNSWGAGFTPFELGAVAADGRVDTVTIGQISVIPAPGAVILVSLGASLTGWLRRRRTI